MITVIHLINTMNPGGAESLLMRLLPALREHDVEPCVASLLGPGPISDALEGRGVRLIDLSRDGTPTLGAYFKLRAAMREIRPDLLHVHSAQAGVLGYVAGRLAGVPVVTTRHSVINPKSGSALYRFERFLTRRYARRVIAVSAEMREKLLAQKLAAPEHAVVHRNAVDTDALAAPERKPFSREEPVIGTIGRLEAPKSHEVFLEMMGHVIERIPGAKGMIVGEGSRRAELEALRSEQGLDDVVYLPGAASPDALAGWLSRFDVFVLSSSWEGLPMVLIEAGAAGLPIVATDVGGVREVVEDDSTGLLTQARDARGLADAVLRILKNDELRRRLAFAAQAHVRDEFDVSRLARQTAELYRDVLSEG